MVSTLFSDKARVRVLYRGDDEGVITDDMAETIVAEVDNKSSIVWVDAEGFRLTTARK